MLTWKTIVIVRWFNGFLTTVELDQVFKKYRGSKSFSHPVTAIILHLLTLKKLYKYWKILFNEIADWLFIFNFVSCSRLTCISAQNMNSFTVSVIEFSSFCKGGDLSKISEASLIIFNTIIYSVIIIITMPTLIIIIIIIIMANLHICHKSDPLLHSGF